MSITIQEFVKKASEHKKNSLETLQYALKAVRGIEEMDRQIKEIREYINNVFKAPKSLTTLEKIVYYFNRKQNITLQEIADEGGYELGYILKISMRINRKLRNIP